jgi:hypothetical protein
MQGRDALAMLVVMSVFVASAVLGVEVIMMALGPLFMFGAVRRDLGDVILSDRMMRLIWGLPRNWSRPRNQDQRDRRWWTGDPIDRSPQRGSSS